MMGFQKEIKLTQNTFHRGFQTLGRLLETDCFCLDNVMEKKKTATSVFGLFYWLQPYASWLFWLLCATYGNVDTPAESVNL